MSDLSPAELLEQRVVLRPLEIAKVLGLCATRGAQRDKPSRPQAIALIRSGKLRLVDDSAPPTRWCVSVAEVKRYLNGAEKIG